MGPKNCVWDRLTGYTITKRCRQNASALWYYNFMRLCQGSWSSMRVVSYALGLELPDWVVVGQRSSERSPLLRSRDLEITKSSCAQITLNTGCVLRSLHKCLHPCGYVIPQSLRCMAVERRQTYSYQFSGRGSLPVGRYRTVQCDNSDRGTCVNNLPEVVTWTVIVNGQVSVGDLLIATSTC